MLFDSSVHRHWRHLSVPEIFEFLGFPGMRNFYFQLPGMTRPIWEYIPYLGPSYFGMLCSRKLGLDLVVRDEEGNVLDPLHSSTIKLFRLVRMPMTYYLGLTDWSLVGLWVL